MAKKWILQSESGAWYLNSCRHTGMNMVSMTTAASQFDNEIEAMFFADYVNRIGAVHWKPVPYTPALAL